MHYEVALDLANALPSELVTPVPTGIVVVEAHIYPPVTGQRQTLTCWTIRTLFITRTTS